MNSWRGWGSKNDLECPPLCSGHIQRKEYFLICSSGKSADFPELPFHGWGRKGRWHICRLPCILLCESWIQKRPQAFLHKNKNRGTQVVKLHVPFLFSSHTVRYQSHRMPRIEMQSKRSCISLEKREWNGEMGLTRYGGPRKSGFSQMLLQAHLLFWCNAVRIN